MKSTFEDYIDCVLPEESVCRVCMGASEKLLCIIYQLPHLCFIIVKIVINQLRFTHSFLIVKARKCRVILYEDSL